MSHAQLEAASGGVDEEARAALAKLQAATSGAPKPEDAAALASGLSEEQLAAQLSLIERQMQVIEDQLHAAEPGTLAIVGEAATAWTAAGKDVEVVKPKDQSE